MLVLEQRQMEKAAWPSVRERELETGRLVLRAAVERDAFLTRRSAAAVGELEAGPARRALRLTVSGLSEGSEDAVTSGLLAYGAVLERHGEHGAAERVFCTVLAARPSDAAIALHTARAARKAGRREEALALYRRAAEQSLGNPRMTLLARIGKALVSEDALQGLTAVLADARRSGDMAAVAIAREERARLHAEARRVPAAVRDLVAAAGRYTDPIDRVRVLHRLAELFTSRGDLLAAREVLLTALELVDAARRVHTVQRLRTVARALGDQLELRRSRGRGNATLVTLAPGPSRRAPAAVSAVSRLRRWRSMLSSAAAN